jgi:tripartite-type tricarboxylate transporter receptor subunit TctC
MPSGNSGRVSLGSYQDAASDRQMWAFGVSAMGCLGTSQAIALALQMPDVRERILTLQAEPVGNTPEGMRTMIRNDTDRWMPVIRAAHISLD